LSTSAVRRVVEQQMRLVEEEHQLRFVEIAGFRQVFEQLGEQPEQQRGVHLWRLHQLVGGEDVDDALAFVGLHQVFDVQHRFAEQFVAALRFQAEQAALDGADAGGGDVAVFGGELFGVFADELQHRAQVFQVEQQQLIVVGDLEYQIQHAGLGSFSSSMRASSNGPMSEMVARTGWPISPKGIPEGDREGLVLM
jgi:hypothetical protein